MSDEIEGSCYKTDHHSMQSCIKKYGSEGNVSAMKDIRNLAIKKDFFGDLEHEDLLPEKKKKELPLLILMVMKIDGQKKSRVLANRKTGESSLIRIQLLRQLQIFMH